MDSSFHNRNCFFLLCTLLSLIWISGCANPKITEEIVFDSGNFRIVGDLTIPEGRIPHPVILFVHGDGPNNRTSGGTYLPIMERMLKVGFATFAWDKPGTGDSTGQFDHKNLLEERSLIVLNAIEILKEHDAIDSQRIGLWGISQAGYVMPIVLSKSDDIAFMIAVSCPGVPGVDQGAYLVSSQASCSGLQNDDAAQMEYLLSAIERAQTYDEYVQYKERLDAFPVTTAALELGYKTGVRPENEWHEPDFEGYYFWDPIDVIEKTTIPVLAFFGSKDTQVDPNQGVQAYSDALERAGNQNYRVELISDADHTMILSETGCLLERDLRSKNERLNYSNEYLDIMESWLQELYP
jgi:pimeloyl-ACP methyl ester carboxylesterase